nr:DUF3052 domain-containing protein [Terriglobales bacterium]
MSGYSGTPLAKKLGLKPGARVTFYSASAEVLAECQAALRECEETARGQVDFAMIFVTTRRQLESKFVLYSHRLKPDGTLWVSWPKKSSGVVSDVDENQV